MRTVAPTFHGLHSQHGLHFLQTVPLHSAVRNLPESCQWSGGRSRGAQARGAAPHLSLRASRKPSMCCRTPVGTSAKLQAELA